MIIDTTSIADAVKQYAHYPLDKLVDNDKFVSQLIGTGENLSRFMVRRFSFRKPRLDIEVSPNKDVINLNMVYGVSAKTTLYTLEREVVINQPGDMDCPIITVPSKDDLLSSLEPMVNHLLDIQGFTFPEDIRYKPLSTFFTDTSKYLFRLAIHVDTLACYADMYIDVRLDYVEIKDCIKGISDHLVEEGIVERDVSHSVFYLEEVEPPVLALRFKQHVTNYPITKTPGI